MNEVLRIEHLCKKYDQFTAVDDVSLTIHKGDIYGFLGQNGAGKTSTIRMILGLIKPTSGIVELFGRSSDQNQMLHRVGAMVEYPGFYKNLTVTENLHIQCKMMAIHDWGAIENNLRLVGLWSARDVVVRKLSLGMKQRLAIARSLIHSPDLLILDEPTNGLDPIGIREIRELLLMLAHEKQMTILFSSHILAEVEQIATRIGIIHQGRLLEEIEMETLRRKQNGFLEIRVSDEQKAIFVLDNEMKLTQYRLIEPGTIRIYERLGDSHLMIRSMVEHHVDVYEAYKKMSTLEDHFITLIQEREGA